MKIGIVTDFYHPWVGGPATVIQNIGHGLVARGHSVYLLAPSPDGEASKSSDGSMEITRVRTSSAPFGYNLRTSVWPMAEVSGWLRRVAPDVVNIHHPFVLSASAALQARRRRIPLLATNHTIPECSLWGIRTMPLLYPFARMVLSRWLVWLLTHCDAVATPTRTAAESLVGLGFHGDVAVISNGVDVERFHPGQEDLALRNSLGLDNRPIVLYTGRLDAEKEMDVWLQAARLLAQRCDVQFVVGGKGADRARLERMTVELGLSDRLHFVGYLPEDRYPLLYRLADVYFITSPVELQSISTLEAVASGLPVVAVRAGALPELVVSGENGALVEPRDWSAAAEVLAHILGDAAVRGQMGVRSRALAERHELGKSIAEYDRLLGLVACGGTAREQTALPSR